MTALAVPIAAIVTGGPIAFVVAAYRKRQAAALRRRERRNAAARGNGQKWAKVMRRDRD